MRPDVVRVLGLFGLGPSIQKKPVCPGGPGCTCGSGVDLREQQEAFR